MNVHLSRNDHGTAAPGMSRSRARLVGGLATLLVAALLWPSADAADSALPAEAGCAASVTTAYYEIDKDLQDLRVIDGVADSMGGIWGLLEYRDSSDEKGVGATLAYKAPNANELQAVVRFHTGLRSLNSGHLCWQDGSLIAYVWGGTGETLEEWLVTKSASGWNAKRMWQDFVFESIGVVHAATKSTRLIGLTEHGSFWSKGGRLPTAQTVEKRERSGRILGRFSIWPRLEPCLSPADVRLHQIGPADDQSVFLLWGESCIDGAGEPRKQMCLGVEAGEEWTSTEPVTDILIHGKQKVVASRTECWSGSELWQRGEPVGLIGGNENEVVLVRRRVVDESSEPGGSERTWRLTGEYLDPTIAVDRKRSGFGVLPLRARTRYEWAIVARQGATVHTKRGVCDEAGDERKASFEERVGVSFETF